MTQVEKTVFISYRRINESWALAVYLNLTHSGFDVFIDYEGIASGDFERVILENIRARAHFLVLLTPAALDRCDEPNDWLRREIEEALEARRNVVPLMLEGFDFRTPTIASKLTGKLARVQRYNGMTIKSAEHFNAAMTKLRDKFLNVPLDAVLHPASASAQQAAKDQKIAIAAASPVPDSESSALLWFERGYKASDPDQQILYYTEALRLWPNSAVTHYMRGLARSNMGDHDGAITDCTEALRLKPEDAEAYVTRGVVRDRKGDLNGAITDCTEAIRLKPNFAKAYVTRGVVCADMGDHDAAITDCTEALRLDPNDAAAYVNRGVVRGRMGDHDGAITDCTEALRLKPDVAEAYATRGLARTI
ncbi:MAG: tetratricopeptide repeat protein, partial [Nitrospira sp.]|nr:tetratricopeptide repeat protein [Nitrospira sp.]